MSTTPAARTPLPRPRAQLEVRNLTVVPPGQTAPTLRGVSFDVHAGEVLALRIRGLVRRRLLEEDDRRIAGEFGDRERALVRARAEAERLSARAG